jgi:hypothetical protein
MMALSVKTCDSRLGFGLEIAYIDHFTTRLETASNYTAIADLHNLQITTTVFSVLYIFTSRSW